MIALYIILGIILFLVLIAFLRVGVSVCFEEGGFSAGVYIGPLPLLHYPRKKKKKKEIKKKRKKRKKRKEAEKELSEIRPGKIKTFVEIIKTAKKTFGRLRKKLLIKRLTIHFVSADEDPAKTALGYGAANAFYGIITPILESAFKIKHRDFRSYADFEAKEPSIYVNAAMSLAVWELIYVVLALMPLLATIQNKPRRSKVRKEGKKDGQATD